MHNYAETDDGKIMDGDNICAKVTSEEGKLMVGPCFLPAIEKFTVGPYVNDSFFNVSGCCTTMRKRAWLWCPAASPTSKPIKDAFSRKARSTVPASGSSQETKNGIKT